jgi:hypothetical protein
MSIKSLINVTKRGLGNGFQGSEHGCLGSSSVVGSNFQTNFFEIAERSSLGDRSGELHGHWVIASQFSSTH